MKQQGSGVFCLGAQGLWSLSWLPCAWCLLLTLRSGSLQILAGWCNPHVPQAANIPGPSPYISSLLRGPLSPWLATPRISTQLLAANLKEALHRITQTAALSPMKGFCSVGNGESGPRWFLALGGWWQQSQGSTLTCEHCRGQDPGEEQQGHAQG